jgi:hypothetical protein
LLKQEKRLIGYITNRRAFSQFCKLNAMLEGALEHILYDEADLLKALAFC